MSNDSTHSDDEPSELIPTKRAACGLKPDMDKLGEDTEFDFSGAQKHKDSITTPTTHLKKDQP